MYARAIVYVAHYHSIRRKGHKRRSFHGHALGARRALDLAGRCHFDGPRDPASRHRERGRIDSATGNRRYGGDSALIRVVVAAPPALAWRRARLGRGCDADRLAGERFRVDQAWVLADDL